MSDPQLDALAESARNRGLKLVRSRVRTPGKRRFGKVGLTDGSGRPILGMDDKGPTATPEEVEDYLRNLGAKDWGASLDVAVLPRKRKPKRSREVANDLLPSISRGGGRSARHAGGMPEGARPDAKGVRGPKLVEGPLRRASRATSPAKTGEESFGVQPPPPPPKPAPKLKIREAKPSDVSRLVELIHFLGHEIDEKAVRRNLKALGKTGELPLVASMDKRVVGMCGVGRRIVIHRPAPLGRITALVVAEEAQGHGIGRKLVEAAEQRMRNAGCKLVEVTSNDRRTAAHAFYRHMGYERTSIRFAKKL